MKRKQDDTAALRVRQMGGDILSSERFQRAKHIPHHGRISVAEHSLYVAKQSCRMAEWLMEKGIKVCAEDAVRAALLHDIGMTSAQVFHSPSWEKAYSHPRQGVEIAAAEFHANPIQCNAILRHMWPVCFIPPKHLTGWIVLAADKVCTLKEPFQS